MAAGTHDYYSALGRINGKIRDLDYNEYNNGTNTYNGSSNWDLRYVSGVFAAKTTDVDNPGFSFESASASGLFYNASAGMGLVTDKALSINSSGGAINIGNDAVDQNVLIGSAGSRPLVILGNSNVTQALIRAVTVNITGGTAIALSGNTTCANNFTLAGAASRLIAESAVAQSGAPVVSVKQTPAGNLTNSIVKIEADGGTYFQSGSACLELVSDDNDCYALIVNNTEADQAWITRAGHIYTLGSLYCNTLTTQTGDIYVYPTSGNLAIGGGVKYVQDSAAFTGASDILMQVVNTPGSNSQSTILQLEAQGANWSAGAHVLNIICDNANAVPITVNNGSADNLTIDRSGLVTTLTGVTISGTTSGQFLAEAATTNVLPLLSLKQTMTSDGSNYIARIEADGTGWGGGAALLLVSDDDSTNVLVVNNGASDTAGWARDGTITTAGDLIFANASSIKTLGGTNLTLDCSDTSPSSVVFAKDTYLSAVNYDDISGTLWEITNTPASGSPVIMRINAAGTNWDGGYCLELISEDSSCFPLAIGSVAGSPAFYVGRSGLTTINADLQFIGSQSISTTAAGDLTLSPDTTGDIIVDGGLRLNTTTVSASTHAVDSTDRDIVLLVTRTASGTCTVTLPTAGTVDGRLVVIKDAGLNASTYNITIDTQGSEEIDGSSEAVLNTDGASLTLISDGTDWFII